MAKKPARKSTAKSKTASKLRKPAARPKPARKPARKASAQKKPAPKKPAARKVPPKATQKSAAKKPLAAVATKAQTRPAAPAAKPTSPAKLTLVAKGKPAGVKPAAGGAKPAPGAKPVPGAKPAAAPAATAAKGTPPKVDHKAAAKAAGEMAAKLATKLGEGGGKKSRNGRHADAPPRELTPADIEARKRRLKSLIVLGKERGYLTYAEINDHLPDDLVDAEQIEGVISMIGDMAIQVFDQAPDADTLLMAESAPAAPTEDVEEEAEAAASTLDSEFGRTTDPVRMYMREMGSVELLTREGEIEIAKRIEDGLKHMIMAISACPMTVGQILDLADKIGKDEIKVDDVVDGLHDFQEQIDTKAVEASDDEDEDEEDDE